MILRKPYAFLIKYFKLIHIVMFIFFGYFVFTIRKIYIFFSDYVKNSNYISFDDMASRYVPIIVFFMILLLLGFAISIFLLMRKKDKPVLFYKITIAYCILLFAVFIYFYFFFNSIDRSSYEPLKIVVCRDIILFVYIVNYIFVAFSFIRGFGFDIKKFSFEKDKKELNLEESDNEEYELNIKLEKEDVVNYLNKQKREFRYYLKENSLILSILGGAVFLGIVIYIVLNFFVYNKVYKEENSVSIGNIVYTVNNSYITNLDKYAKVMSATYDYLIVDLSVTNNGSASYLDDQALRVHVDDEYYYPHTASCSSFDDLGECYQKQQIKSETTTNYFVVFRIKKEHQKIFLEILKSKGSEYNYDKILLSTKSFDREDQQININDTFSVGNESYQIKSVQIVNKTSYQYSECQNEVCNTYIKNVTPKTGDVVLVLEIDNLDKLSDEYIKSIFGLKYGKKVVYGNDLKLLYNHENKLYYSVSSGAKTANDLNITITTRNIRYYLPVGEV